MDRVGLLALSPAVMAYADFPWLEFILVAWLCMIGAGMIVAMRGDWRLIGPRFWFDLVRLARELICDYCRF
jgi:hypothetical protein